jgi:subfamily B ATP-binding cassette protein HlyB/CyaB
VPEPIDLSETERLVPEQSSALHALVAVLGRHGLDFTVGYLRSSYALGEAEPASKILVAIARDLGLEARQSRLRWRDLPRLHNVLPAILRLDDGGALLLEDIRETDGSGAVAILRDPTASADALIAIDEAQLARVWSGEIILAKRRYRVGDARQPFGLMWLLGEVMRERRLFFEIALAALTGTVFAVVPPFMFMIVIDRVLTSSHSHATLTVLTVAILLMILFETVLGYLRRLLMEVATTRIDGRLNLFIVDRLLKLPMGYFEQNPTGMIMSKLARIWQIRHFLTGQLFGALLDALPLCGLIPALLFLEWRLALLVFVLTAVIFFIVLGFIRPLARRFRRVVLAEQEKGAHLVEGIYGMRTIKSLAIEGRRRREWDVRVAEATAARHSLGLLANYPQTMILPFERLIYSGSFLLGAFMYLAEPGTIYPGALIAFSMLSARLAQPLVQLARLMQELAEVRGAIDEVATVMNAPPEEDRAGSGLRLPIEGEITFDDVRFRYSAGAPLALDRVSFRVPRGTMLGIMGRSGSGKTTVTRLLQGLHTGYEGLIKIDGMDLREIDLTHLRTSIGVVHQESFLFKGTIRDNIAAPRPEATFAEVVRAAQMAGAEEFIERLPQGYNTPLEEAAVNLSGGQRQRLAIARALIIDPPVLVLDEATSSLDAESEAIVNANLQRMASGRTIVCISHRLSMLVDADAILVLERGRVYDIGTHDELLRRCDIYRQLWQQQNRHMEMSSTQAQLSVVGASDG